MRQRSSLKRSTRLRMVLLAVVALLFQQIAFAAFAYPVGAMPMATMTAGDYQAAAMSLQPANDEMTHALCVQCCVQPIPATQGEQVPTVPSSQLTAVMPIQPVIFKWPAWSTAQVHSAAERMPALAPPLRYRVLLI